MIVDQGGTSLEEMFRVEGSMFVMLLLREQRG